MLFGSQEVMNRLGKAGRLWLFLDYDGTLADFAPTPDDILPDPEVIDIVRRLEEHPDLRVGVVSGRRLDHIRALLPVQGVLFAGTYGIEMIKPNGERVNRLSFEEIRPTLDCIKPKWRDLTTNRKGFYLEDKRWSLALHARFADDQEANLVLEVARETARKNIDGRLFRILGGYKFLEVSPKLAHKGKTIEFVLNEIPWEGAIPVYIGDDDKDEEAFEVINQHKGVSILVSAHARKTKAELRLQSPQVVREWLKTLIS